MADSEQRKPGPRRIEEGALATRELLLQAAHDLMVESGSVDFSLSEIAARANLSSALVKYYFGNKDGIFIELLKMHRAQPGQLDGLLAADLPASVKLEMHIRAIVNIYARSPYLNQLILKLLRKGSDFWASDIVEVFSTSLATFHKKLLAQGVADGTLRDIDPMSFNFILVGACENIFSRQAVLKVAFGMDEIDESAKRAHVRQIISVVLHGVGGPKARRERDTAENQALPAAAETGSRSTG